MNDASKVSPPHGRRDFLKKLWAGLIGAIVGLFPVGAGLAVFLDPLRRKTAASGAIRVTTLKAVPNDGVPRKFPAITDRVDAWNRTPQVPIGAVYLRRTGDQTVEALNVVCPHAGGFVDYVPSSNCFVCPLHNSRFALDGKISDPKSPAPRPMDSLEVEIRNGEIWVKFQNFQSGPSKKLPA